MLPASSTVTWWPACDNRRAACNPAAPAPMMIIDLPIFREQNWGQIVTKLSLEAVNFYYFCRHLLHPCVKIHNPLRSLTQPLARELLSYHFKGNSMQIQFIRNIQFTKLVKADGRLREFNFRKSNGLQEGLFTVDVSDDRGNRIVLRMQREDGVWKIVKQQLPTWIWENENVLHTLIEEELGAAGIVK
jgi:hypothetical protein